MKHAKTLHEKLFVLMLMSDDRSIRATYVDGRKVHDRDRKMRDPFADKPKKGIKQRLGDAVGGKQRRK